MNRSKFYLTAGGTMTMVCLLMGNSYSQDFPTKSPLKAIEAYTFVLPAIDCYRTTKVEFTTSNKTLDGLLSMAMDQLEDDDLAEIKAAANRGARSYDAFVQTYGRQSFCEHVVQRYGPNGSIFAGLLVRRSS